MNTKIANYSIQLVVAHTGNSILNLFDWRAELALSWRDRNMVETKSTSKYHCVHACQKSLDELAVEAPGRQRP